MARLRVGQLTALLMATNVVIACGGGGSDPPPDNTTITVTKSDGDAQNGTVGQPLASPIRVTATEAGAPAPGVTVNWSTPAPGGVMTPTAGPTDANGVASSGWTLGGASGNQTAHAAVSGATGSPVTFTATAAAGAAANLDKGVPSGDNQTGEINTALAAPLQATVTDQFGNGVAGVGVNWSATGATVSAPTVPTDATGQSPVTVTLGNDVGSITIVAASDGLTGSPLTFNATAVVTAAPPASIAITVGNDFFRSDRNNTTSPAVDTLAVGGTATWTWAAAAAPHSVTSTGSPSFTSSITQDAPASHSFIFLNAGTYRYYCTVHALPNDQGGMVGRIVVR